ncbi:hypothetical protein P7K49_001831 [Saguinus oedipus]|uniref:Uncharacterized protein n=1 Tax=Saguinus oedipus TaxID=9490 RepID=A0ABQ9WG29_SAGOE|nr:hypothetical protein P7K49_001831 [Saguinus oedipus]
MELCAPQEQDLCLAVSQDPRLHARTKDATKPSPCSLQGRTSASSGHVASAETAKKTKTLGFKFLARGLYSLQITAAHRCQLSKKDANAGRFLQALLHPEKRDKSPAST